MCSLFVNQYTCHFKFTLGRKEASGFKMEIQSYPPWLKIFQWFLHGLGMKTLHVPRRPQVVWSCLDLLTLPVAHSPSLTNLYSHCSIFSPGTHPVPSYLKAFAHAVPYARNAFPALLMAGSFSSFRYQVTHYLL